MTAKAKVKATETKANETKANETLSFEQFLKEVETTKKVSSSKGSSSYQIIYSLVKANTKDEKKKVRKQMQKFLSNESIYFFELQKKKQLSNKKFLDLIFKQINKNFKNSFDFDLIELDIKNSFELVNYFNIDEFKTLRTSIKS